MRYSVSGPDSVVRNGAGSRGPSGWWACPLEVLVEALLRSEATRQACESFSESRTLASTLLPKTEVFQFFKVQLAETAPAASPPSAALKDAGRDQRGPEVLGVSELVH